MSVDILLHEQVALWLVDGRPDRMVWRGERWRVLGQPIRLTEAPEWEHPAITHLPSRVLSGWRFRARSESTGALREFEARTEGELWFVVAALAR